MQDTINQIEEIEANIQNNSPDLLMHINKKYRDLTEKLDKLTLLIPVTFDEIR